jgi:hypothetical protein
MGNATPRSQRELADGGPEEREKDWRKLRSGKDRGQE